VVSDDATVTQLAVAFQRMGANAEQARVMAAQLLKRARQVAQEKKTTEETALAELLAKVTSGRSGDYRGP
jgi:threonine aldolase